MPAQCQRLQGIQERERPVPVQILDISVPIVGSRYRKMIGSADTVVTQERSAQLAAKIWNQQGVSVLIAAQLGAGSR